MFLNYINDDCKEDVLDMAIYIAFANAVLDENEEEALEQYFVELGIKKRKLTPRYSMTDNIRNVCRCTTLRERKMIAFELTALACVDGVCDDEEQKLLIEIFTAFQIQIAEIETMKSMILRLRKLYCEIAEVIGRED